MNIWIVLICVVLIVAYLFNSLVRSRNNAMEGWSDIEVQLKRRYDLIPNLVEVVKGYATHEKELLEHVATARTQAMQNSGSIEEKQNAENAVHHAVKSLFAVSENYPDLKANQNFLALQDELVDTENKIQAARRFYNSVVREYNTKLEAIPTNIIASALHFEKIDFFELEDEKEAVAPTISSASF